MIVVPIPRHKNGDAYITKEWLKEHCFSKELYKTPRLNK